LGLIETDMSGQLSDEYQTKLLEMIPLGRFGNVQEVAEIVCFMLSDAARYITGQVVQADGGLAM
jgi:3-oxoacyl-[acyl-carrier protein] reductase